MLHYYQIIIIKINSKIELFDLTNKKYFNLT